MAHERVQGDMTAAGKQFAIVAARFNEYIVDSLVKGALDVLGRHGANAAEVPVVTVPGAFEIPLTAQRLARTGKYDAIIALGVVIRGATPHFEYVAGQTASGVASVALAENLPVVFGVLTTETIEQAIERAGTKAGNKGADAALTAIEMVSLLGKL